MTSTRLARAMFVACCVGASAVVAPPASLHSQAASGAIAGRVITAERDPQPLRRVRVSVNAAGGPQIGRTVVTDDDGQFRVEGLPAGRYAVSAVRPAFLMVASAATPVVTAKQIAVVRAGAATDVELVMIRGGVITGRVLDPEGRRAPHQYVTLFRTTVEQGRARFDPVRVPSANLGFYGVVTDDLGEYRLYGIPPGEYVVAVGRGPSVGYTLRQVTAAEVARAMTLLKESPDARRTPPTFSLTSSASAGPAVFYAPVFYPGTTRASSALPVVVEPESEISGIDMRMELVGTAVVRGTIVGSPLDPGSGRTRMARVVSLGPAIGDRSVEASVVIAADGSFSAAGLTPGEYRLEARTLALSPGPPRVEEWAALDLVIAGQDVEGVHVSLQPALTLAGRTVFAPSSGVSAPASVTVRLIPVDAPAGSWATPLSGAAREGTFELPGVIPGTYRLSAELPRDSPWAFAGATVNGRDAADTAVDIQGPDSARNVVVSFTTGRTHLEGRLVGAGSDAAAFSVLVFPATPVHWFPGSRRVAVIPAADDGSFELQTLPPGRYLVAVLRGAGDADDWGRAVVLDTLTSSSIPVVLEYGRRTVQDIRIVGRASSR